MPRTRPPYPPEFRIEAVRMLRAGCRTPKQLAAELGCSEQTLRNWLRQDEADRGERAGRAHERGAAAAARARARKQGVAPGARDPEAGRGFLCQGDRSTVTRFRFVEAEAAQFPVSLLCRVVGVTRQGFYAWKRRPPSARELADRELAERIKQIYTETRGDLRCAADLLGAQARRRDPGRQEARRPVDAAARDPRRRRQTRRAADDGPRPEAGLGARPGRPRLRPAEPNRLWVCDLKYIQTGQGFLFLAVVQDVFSRRIIGWSMRDDLKTELVLDALGMAVTAAAETPPAWSRTRITVRSTRVWSTAPTRSSPGSTSRWARSATPGTTPSPRASSPASRKSCSAANGSPTREQARLRVFWYIECFYNPRRRHSSLGMLSPIDYEQQHQQEAIAA